MNHDSKHELKISIHSLTILRPILFYLLSYTTSPYSYFSTLHRLTLPYRTTFLFSYIPIFLHLSTHLTLLLRILCLCNILHRHCSPRLPLGYLEREEEEAKKRNSASLQYKELLIKQMSEADKRRKEYVNYHHIT